VLNVLSVSNELKEKIIQLNIALVNNYKYISELDKEKLREFINKFIGVIGKLNKLSSKELEKYAQRGGVLGVDGSRNKIGGAHPHFVEIFQGLSRSSVIKDPIYKADFYTPLYMENEMEILSKISKDEPSKEEKDNFIRNYKLSSIEVEVALEGIERLNPLVVMMDGSLIRYKIECSDKWNELKKQCEERGIILIGVIKDIKTSIIGASLIENKIIDPLYEDLYDREVLYGTLNHGEFLTIKKEILGKAEEGLSSCFMRSSKEPTVIGMDILSSQDSFIEEMANLVFTLTPEMGRGIPLWLDIIDSEVKISDKILHSLLERYIDRDVLEKLFISERSKRTL